MLRSPFRLHTLATSSSCPAKRIALLLLLVLLQLLYNIRAMRKWERRQVVSYRSALGHQRVIEHGLNTVGQAASIVVVGTTAKATIGIA